MARYILIKDVNEQTYIRMRMLCLGKGVTTRQLFEELVDNAYKSDTTIPDKSRLRKMKRFVKQLK